MSAPNIIDNDFCFAAAAGWAALFHLLQINMDSDVFRNSSKLSSQRWRAVVEVVLTDMGAHDGTLEEKGCDLYLYVDALQGVVKGMIITEQVRTSASACFFFNDTGQHITMHHLNMTSSPTFLCLCVCVLL